MCGDPARGLVGRERGAGELLRAARGFGAGRQQLVHDAVDGWIEVGRDLVHEADAQRHIRGEPLTRDEPPPRS